MDTTNIDSNKINEETGWHMGSKDAPVKVVEFINLRCPHCKEWWDNTNELLTSYVENGTVERIVKHYDKNKDSLRNGNVLHSYLSYEENTNIKEQLDEITARLDEWGSLPQEEAGRWAEENLNLTKQDNQKQSSSIIQEAKEANVKFVPTVFIGSHIFDENISNEELKQLIEAATDELG